MRLRKVACVWETQFESMLAVTNSIQLSSNERAQRLGVDGDAGVVQGRDQAGALRRDRLVSTDHQYVGILSWRRARGTVGGKGAEDGRRNRVEVEELGVAS